MLIVCNHAQLQVPPFCVCFPWRQMHFNAVMYEYSCMQWKQKLLILAIIIYKQGINKCEKNQIFVWRCKCLKVNVYLRTPVYIHTYTTTGLTASTTVLCDNSVACLWTRSHIAYIAMSHLQGTCLSYAQQGIPLLQSALPRKSCGPYHSNGTLISVLHSEIPDTLKAF